MADEPNTPVTPQVPEQPVAPAYDFAKLEERLGVLDQITEGLTAVNSKIEELDSWKQNITGGGTQNQPEVPKSWQEVYQKAADEAEARLNRTLTEQEQEQLRVQAEQEAVQKAIDAEFDKQEEDLVKEGKLPAKTDPKYKEEAQLLYKLGTKFNSPDLKAMAALRDDILKSNGLSFDFESGKALRGPARAPGADSPVSSSARSAATTSQGPDYKTIHNARSMDELIRKSGVFNS